MLEELMRNYVSGHVIDPESAAKAYLANLVPEDTREDFNRQYVERGFDFRTLARNQLVKGVADVLEREADHETTDPFELDRRWKSVSELYTRVADALSIRPLPPAAPAAPRA